MYLRVTVGNRLLAEEVNWGLGPLGHFYFSTTQKLKKRQFFLKKSLLDLHFFQLNLVFFVRLECQQILNLFHFCFSGVQESESEVIDISNLHWPEDIFVHWAFVHSGFADDRLGRNKLRPCPLGTFANSSSTNLNCRNCSAGKL